MIRVFPRATQATPTDDLVRIGEPHLWDRGNGETVHISCTFTWDKAECERLAELWEHAGYSPILGGPAYGDHGGEFVSGRYIQRGYVITTRGCNNSCWFCDVWRREGGIRELPITSGFNVLDSNLLQSSDAHIRNVFAMLTKQKNKAEFTGGLEAARLQDWHVDLLVDLKPRRFYFAYDTPDDYEPLVIAAKKVRDAGFRYWHVSCYVLIGYPKDTMDDANRRLEQVCRLGLFPMAMLWRDIDGKYDITWRQFQREWVRTKIVATKIKEMKGGPMK